MIHRLKHKMEFFKNIIGIEDKKNDKGFIEMENLNHVAFL